MDELKNTAAKEKPLVRARRIARKMRDRLEQLYAVELLEYHDRNWLHGSPKSRSERIQRELECLLSEVNEICMDTPEDICP